MKIIADAHIPFIHDYFGDQGDLHLIPGREITSTDVKDADILIVRSVTHVNEQLLSGSKVSFVGSITAGADHLDTKWLDQANIIWCIAAGFNAPPVADYVVSTVAALQHHHLLANNNIKVAVIGAGHVGSLVAKQLKILGCDVSVCDPIRAENEKNFLSIPLETLRDMDLISLHVPLEKAGRYPTYHLIDKHFIQRQKLGCILLNASRGAVIDSHALAEYGAHLRWCLDVWEHEPHISKHLLEKVFIGTPHIAGYSVQSKMRGIDMIYRLACENNMIKPKLVSPINMPQQTLPFSAKNVHWQDVVLGVFNPVVMTKMMQAKMLTTDDDKFAFDALRSAFNYRHEFGFTRIVTSEIRDADEVILRALGFTFN